MKICSRTPKARKNEWMKIKRRSIYDDRHKVMMCWMSKAGCTSFKALLLEAAGFNLSSSKFGVDMLGIHSDELLIQYGLDKMVMLSDDKIKEILGKYFVFMLIRHPFERLLSTYRGKVLNKQSDIPWFAAETLKLSHSDIFENNKTLARMKAPQNVLGSPTFSQFLDWIRISNTYNDHWSMIVEACHPCAHNWSAILKLETMEHDSRLLIEHLKPDLNISAAPVRHSHQNEPVHNHDWLRMPEYDDVTEETIEYLLQMYEIDLKMFGYKWDKARNIASCSIDTVDGLCC
ncbi:hypothetical protein LSH36_87g02052 [Paralvinella palmiformis]|uniref:Carbohydrate sulfotransferase n=1 Tax=Paralvinella palmiformis TaxID=53620 RepID=A0AAD9NAL4_9ANNE|nr:hypothetical protein LSH36_87g02052 [Paralvinella palmiformis]